jgi:arabinan endo-1,5-alpha-L-arabinosidase
MKYALLTIAFALAAFAFALDGQIGIHDPSTIVQCDGKYYTYGTGGSALVSDDGWTWRAGVRPARAGLAPDVIHIGDRYYMYVAANIGAQPKAAINMIWSKSLDPNSPDYKWVEGGVVASSDGIEDCNAIDPGVFLDPNDGKLWLVYGSYFGYIRLVELDPKTGKRLNPNVQPGNLAINCEASASERCLAGGIYNIGASFGSMLAPPLAAWAIWTYNWRVAFVITGALGLVWVPLWLLFMSRPRAIVRTSNCSERVMPTCWRPQTAKRTSYTSAGVHCAIVDDAR